MQKIVLNNIEIIYEDYQVEKVNYIKSIINNNIEFLTSILDNKLKLSLIPLDLENVIYIKDFDDFFKQIVFDYFNDEKVQKTFDNPDLLPSLYIEILIRKYDIDDNQSFVKPNAQISEEMLDFLTSYKYFSLNGTLEDFVNYLKTRCDTHKIIEWLFDEYRFKTYNYLLKITTNYLIDNDFDFLENISDIAYKMLVASMNLPLSKDYEKNDLPAITKQELDDLILEFFEFVKAPISWKQTYKELKDNKQIIFVPSNDTHDFSKCYFDSDNILKIKIKDDGTVICLYSFIHEFAHYMSMKDVLEVSQISVSEIPSIFFERLAIIFLKSKGFNNKDIDILIDRRKRNNFQLYLSLLPLFVDLIKYIKEGEITKEEKVKFLESEIETVKEFRKELIEELEGNSDINTVSMLNEIIDFDISKQVDRQCDSLIYSFIQEGLFVINGYQYILATFITDELLKKYSCDLDIISKMFDTTSNLNNINLKDILTIFEIEDLFIEYKEVKDKKLSKKR